MVVQAPYGRGQRAVQVMQSCGPVDSELLPAYSPRNPAPLSEALGIPPLTRGSFRPLGALTKSQYFLTLGIGLLSRNPTPLSSLFGLKTLTTAKPWRTSFGLPLLSRSPTPLSSLFGLRTIRPEKRPWNRSFGLPLLSRDPAPLSDFLGIEVLSKRRKDREGRG